MKHPYTRLRVNGVVTYEHILVVTEVMRMDRPHWRMPDGAVVHHVNDAKDDNRNQNLVVLQNHGEHQDLHYRRDVLRAGGNPWTDRLCSTCGPKPAGEFWMKTKYGRQKKRPRSKCKQCYRVAVKISS